MTDDEIIEGVLAKEGGYVDDPSDRGGPTNYGITIATLSEWLGRRATVDDVKALTRLEAATIYRAAYIERPGFWQIKDDTLRELVVDTGVNMGTRAATRMLQAALGVDGDGVFGPRTKAALDACDPKAIFARMCANRAMRYGRIITDDPRQARFAAGWMRRIAEFIERIA